MKKTANLIYLDLFTIVVFALGIFFANMFILDRALLQTVQTVLVSVIVVVCVALASLLKIVLSFLISLSKENTQNERFYATGIDFGQTYRYVIIDHKKREICGYYYDALTASQQTKKLNDRNNELNL